MDFMFRGEAELEKKLINSFMKLCIETEMFGLTKETFERKKIGFRCKLKKSF